MKMVFGELKPTRNWIK